MPLSFTKVCGAPGFTNLSLHIVEDPIGDAKLDRYGYYVCAAHSGRVVACREHGKNKRRNCLGDL